MTVKEKQPSHTNPFPKLYSPNTIPRIVASGNWIRSWWPGTGDLSGVIQSYVTVKEH